MRDFQTVLDNLYYLDKYKEASEFLKGDANVMLRELPDDKAKPTLGHLAKRLRVTTKWLLRAHNYSNEEEMYFDRVYDSMIVKVRAGLCTCKYDVDLEKMQELFGQDIIDCVELHSNSTPFVVAICKFMNDEKEDFRLYMYKVDEEGVTINPLEFDTPSRWGLCKICYNSKPTDKKPSSLSKPELIRQAYMF